MREIMNMIEKMNAGEASPRNLGMNPEGYARLREAQTRDDFDYIFQDVIDRQLLMGYQDAPTDWERFVRLSTVPDFREVKRYRVHGQEGTLDEVGEKEEYPVEPLTDEEFAYQVAKYGRTFSISWESIVNDDLNALRDTPQRYGRAARRTEAKFVSELYANNTDLYTSGRGNRLEGGDSELSIEALEDAWEHFGQMTDEDDEPILIRPRYLVVPPHLEITGRNLLTAIRLWVEDNDDHELEIDNYWGQMLELIVDPYLPIVDGDYGETAWYLFADKNDLPALEVGRLAGHEDPQVFVKKADMQPVGGGSPDPYAGDFQSDNIKFKVRHVIGGTALDWRATLMAQGQ